MKYILAFDQGTTSSRSVLVDPAGHLVDACQQEFPQHFPRPGWVEHDAEEIWTAQLATAEELVNKHSLGPEDIAAIGITNQRETAVLWDRQTGQPIHHAIVWQDRRTSNRWDAIKAQAVDDLVEKKTGLLFDPYFSATKIAWLLDNVPSARERAEAGELAAGTIDSWLIWKLTGGQTHITDASNASRTMLCDIHTCQWDEQLLTLFDIPSSLLPEIRPSSQQYTTVSVSDRLRGIPIAGIAGDQQAALFGESCWEPGLAKNTYGTGCFLLLNTGSEAIASNNKLLTTVAWQVDGKTEYALEGSIFMGGAIVQWLRDELGIIEKSSDIRELAASVPDSGDVFFVPALTGLGAPHWDALARGTILGITRGTSKAHIARAAVEGIAFQVADVLDAMQADSGIVLEELRVDGGAAVDDLLLQFQADILQIPVVRPTVLETTALGAAYLAGLAVGFWKDRNELTQHWEVEHRFVPNIGAAAAKKLRSRWSAAVQRARNWAEEDA